MDYSVTCCAYGKDFRIESVSVIIQISEPRTIRRSFLKLFHPMNSYLLHIFLFIMRAFVITYLTPNIKLVHSFTRLSSVLLEKKCKYQKMMYHTRNKLFYRKKDVEDAVHLSHPEVLDNQIGRSFTLPRIHIPSTIFPPGDGQYSDNNIQNKIILLQDEEYLHYIRTVMRCRDGAQVRIFNSDRGEWLTQVTSIQPQNLHQVIFKNKGPINLSSTKSKKKQESVLGLCLLDQLRKAEENQRVSIKLGFGPIRAERLKWMFEKGTELGITDFFPILTQFTQPANSKLFVNSGNQEFASSSIGSKEARFESILIQSAEQCERLTIPKLHPIINLDDFLSSLESRIRDKSHDPDSRVVFYICKERSDQSSQLLNTLQQLRNSTNPAQNLEVYLLIGPEGGFSPQEAKRFEELQRKEFLTLVSLGDNILRTETAAIHAIGLTASYLNYS